MAQAIRDSEGFVQSISNIPEDEDFVVYGTIHAFPESADALEAVYVETTRLAQNEPGTVYYCICRVWLRLLRESTSATDKAAGPRRHEHVSYVRAIQGQSGFRCSQSTAYHPKAVV
jgi:hypothetical protein